MCGLWVGRRCASVGCDAPSVFPQDPSHSLINTHPRTPGTIPATNALLGIDYSNFDAAAQKKVEKALKGLEVGVLVNNVGVSYEFPMYFDELSDEQVRACACLLGLSSC